MKNYPLKHYLWEYMKTNPMSTQELAEYLGISLRYAQEYMVAMRNMGTINRKRLRIVGWNSALEERRSGSPAPIYAIGTGKDAPKPEPLTEKETAKRYWDKYKSVQNAKRRVRVNVWHGLVDR